MRDEFSDELDGPIGNDSNSRNAGTTRSGGSPGDEFWRDIDAGNRRTDSGSRIQNNGTGNESLTSGTERSRRERASGSSNTRTGNAQSRRGKATAGTVTDDATGAGTGDGGIGNGGHSADSGTAETSQIPFVDSFRISEPKSVGYGELGKDKKRAATDKFDLEILKLGVEFTYTMPTLVLPPGTADHWPLSDQESDELAKRLQTLLASLPGKKKSRLMKLFEQHGPWIMFAVSASLITYPKIQITRQLLAQQRAGNNAEHQAEAGTIPFRRYPNFNASETRNTASGGGSSSPNGANGNGRAGNGTFNAGPEDF